MYHHIKALLLLFCYGLIIYGIITPDKYLRALLIPIGIILIFIYPIIVETLLNISTKLFSPREDQIRFIHLDTHRLKFSSLNSNKIPICYSKDYNITACGMEKFHPFDSCKYGRIFTSLSEKGYIDTEKVFIPQLPSRHTLLTVMSSYYLLKLNYSLFISKYVELPICFLPAEYLQYRLLNPMLRATAGTLDGACLAIEHGWAINLSGGYHHATKSTGGGFCIYPDITFAVHHLRRFHKDSANKIMIIDLDAHQGNGYERDLIDDTNVFVVDCYNKHIYPGDNHAKKAIKKEIFVDYRHSDEEYLETIERNILDSVRLFRPDFVIYNAGTDCMQGDPLGNLNLSSRCIIERDEFVFSVALKEKIPILMLLSGGYQKINALVISESIENILNKFNLIKNYSIIK